MPDYGEVAIELLKEIGEAFNSRDSDRIAAYFADDATFMTARGPDPWGHKVQGKEAIRKFLAERFKVIPDMSWHRQYEYVCGTRGVTAWRVTGKSANGEDLDCNGCDLYEFRGNKIHRKDTYWKIVDPSDLGGLPSSD